jgi:hypothetical protein
MNDFLLTSFGHTDKSVFIIEKDKGWLMGNSFSSPNFQNNTKGVARRNNVLVLFIIMA